MLLKEAYIHINVNSYLNRRVPTDFPTFKGYKWPELLGAAFKNGQFWTIFDLQNANASLSG
jgi:hypothetical protein